MEVDIKEITVSRGSGQRVGGGDGDWRRVGKGEGGDLLEGLSEGVDARRHDLRLLVGQPLQ